MAGKKVKSEVEGIRSELQNLSEAVWALREHVSVQAAVAAASTPIERSPNGVGGIPGATIGVATDLANRAEHDDERGITTTRGVFRDSQGAREYRWESEETAETLLALDDGVVAQMLAAIGHRQRLAILKAILNRPSSASDLVSSLHLGTTGAAYHHLNVLQAADLVTQEERGIYVVRPHRVSAIFAILAGVLSANDTTYATSDESTRDGEDVVELPTEDRAKRKKRKAA